MKFNFVFVLFSIIASQSFGFRTLAEQCPIGFSVKKTGSYEMSYTQERGLFLQTWRTLHEKGFNTKILNSNDFQNQVHIEYSPQFDSQTKIASCRVQIHIQGSQSAKTYLYEDSEAITAYKPRVDPVLNVCWNVITQSLASNKILADCPIQKQQGTQPKSPATEVEL